MANDDSATPAGFDVPAARPGGVARREVIDLSDGAMADAEPDEHSAVHAVVVLAEAQRRTLEALQEVRREHERMRTEHTALRQVIAHELSNPLAAVKGALDLLATRDLPADTAAGLLERARRQAHQLAELIDDLLGMPVSPSLEAERAELEAVEVSDLVSDVVEAVSHRIPDDRLVTRVPDELELMTSPPRLRRVLVNLITNAARYSPPSTPVQLCISARRDDVVIEVIDEGAGVDPHIAEEMFAPFVSGADPDTEGAGLGLGLWVVRSMVMSLGGTVQLLPNQPTGTRAVVVLPQHRQDDPVGSQRVLDLTAGDLRAIRSLSAGAA